jgi:hypothetical protein
MRHLRPSSALILNWFTEARIAITIAFLAMIFTFYQGYVARETMHHALRAYVSLTKADLDCPRCDKPETLTLEQMLPPTAPTKPGLYPGAQIHILFEVSGETPAYDIDENITTKEMPTEDLPQHFDFKEVPDINKPVHPVISRTAPLEATEAVSPIVVLHVLGKPVLDPRLSQTPEPPSVLFMYGHVDYTDVFHERHHTHFCLRFIPKTQWAHAYWGFCPKHNEQD